MIRFVSEKISIVLFFSFKNYKIQKIYPYLVCILRIHSRVKKQTLTTMCFNGFSKRSKTKQKIKKILR